MNAVTWNVSGSIATITLNRPQSYNALTRQDYDDFAEALRAIDKREDVLVTVWQATGKYFCAGTDVGASGSRSSNVKTIREYFIQGVTRSNTDVSHALYTHSKVLVAALNGPVLGIAAAFLGHFDFIYALPGAWLMVPFTFLGLTAEAGSSVSLVDKLGISLANEVLLFGKKLAIGDLEKSRFVNKVFPEQSAASFHANVHSHLLKELDGLDPKALLSVRSLIKTGQREKNTPEAVNLRESYAQAERFQGGVPARRFRQLAIKEIRHKL